MKLKEGMYVKFGQVVCRIDEIEDNYISFDRDFYDHWNELTCSMNYDRFVNDYKPVARHDIINLVEVGDYVNGERVTRVIPQDICGDEILDYQHIFVNDKELFIEDIKSLVTKEQFESMSYKVGD